MKIAKVTSVLLILVMGLVLQPHAEEKTAVSGSPSRSEGTRMQDGASHIIGTVGRPVIGITSSPSAVVSSVSRYLRTIASSGGSGVVAAPAIASRDAVSLSAGAGQNFPNPLNPNTWIPYQLSADNQVVIYIYDIRGHLVRKLDLGYRPTGFYIDRTRAAYWDGKNEAGEPVSSGVYFYTIQAGEFTAAKKMIVAR